MRLVPIDIAALANGVGIRTIRRWVKAGAPHHRFGRHHRFDLHALHEWRHAHGLCACKD